MLPQRCVMVVGCRVIEKTLDLIVCAVARLPTVVEPSLPVHVMIFIGLSLHLVGEAEPTAVAQRLANTGVQAGFVDDVMKADGTNNEIERVVGKVQILKSRRDVCWPRSKAKAIFVDAWTCNIEHFGGAIDEGQRRGGKSARECQRQISGATA